MGGLGNTDEERVQIAAAAYFGLAYSFVLLGLYSLQLLVGLRIRQRERDLRQLKQRSLPWSSDSFRTSPRTKSMLSFTATPPSEPATTAGQLRSVPPAHTWVHRVGTVVSVMMILFYAGNFGDNSPYPRHTLRWMGERSPS